MKKVLYLGIVLAMLCLITNIFAYNVSIDSALVNSDSNNTFANVQYATISDNIDLKYQLTGTGFNNYLLVYVQPVVYSLINNEYFYFDSAPPQLVHLAPNSAFNYTYTNLFYFDNDYTSYRVDLLVSATDGTLLNHKSAYVYYSGTPVPQSTSNNFNNNYDSNSSIIINSVNCSGFNLSGSNISIDEDDDDYYHFHINNNLNSDLTITSVSTGSPNHLSIDNLDYPAIVYANDSEEVTFDIESDSLSHDYSSSFNINVSANYPGIATCTETLQVSYNIDAGSNSSDADCSDLSIEDLSFAMHEDDSEDKTIIIENNSDDYDFDVTSVTITHDSDLDTDVSDYPSYVNNDSDDEIDLQFDSDAVSLTKTIDLTLKVKGNLEDNGDTKSCTINKNITVTVVNDGDDWSYWNSYYQTYNDNYNYNGNYYYSSCPLIDVMDKTVTNGTNQINISNSSNMIFYVTGLIAQNVVGLSLTNLNHYITLYGGSISGTNITVNGTGSAKLLVSGHFSNGDVCTYTQTNSGFITTASNVVDNNSYVTPVNDFNCNISLVYPTSLNILDAIQSYEISIANNSYNGGSIEITSDGSSVDVPIIYLSGNDNFKRTITLANFNNPNAVNYKVKLNNCAVKEYTTKLFDLVTSDKKIIVSSYPTVISNRSNFISTSAEILNTFNITKQVIVKLSGFPSDWIMVSNDVPVLVNTSQLNNTFTINAGQKKTIYFGVTIPEDTLYIKYNGYLEIYSGEGLVLKTPVTIDRTLPIDKITVLSTSFVPLLDFDNGYKLTINLLNNTSVERNLNIDFSGVDSTTVIDGNKEFTIEPNKDINLEYRIITKNKLTNNDLIKYSITDKSNNEILAEEDATLQGAGTSGVTGFFSFSTSTGIIKTIALVVIVILIISYIIYQVRKSSKKSMKQRVKN